MNADLPTFYAASQTVSRQWPLTITPCLTRCQPTEPHPLKSHDSPSSTMSIGVQIETESPPPILEDLDEAAAKLNRHPGRESVAHLLSQALHTLHAIMKVVKPIADVSVPMPDTVAPLMIYQDTLHCPRCLCIALRRTQGASSIPSQN